MRKIALGASTMEYAEVTVDYSSKKADFAKIPDDGLANRLIATATDVITHIIGFFVPIGTTALVLFLISSMFHLMILKFFIEIIFTSILFACIVLIFSIPILSLDKKFDMKIKKFFADMTTRGHKINKVAISDFKSKVFMIPNFQNVMLKYTAFGDVAKQLDKIKIRYEPIDSVFKNQGEVAKVILPEYFLKNVDPYFWNAYFLFKELPKDGELYIEFI